MKLKVFTNKSNIYILSAGDTLNDRKADYECNLILMADHAQTSQRQLCSVIVHSQCLKSAPVVENSQ